MARCVAYSQDTIDLNYDGMRTLPVWEGTINSIIIASRSTGSDQPPVAIVTVINNIRTHDQHSECHDVHLRSLFLFYAACLANNSVSTRLRPIPVILDQETCVSFLRQIYTQFHRILVLKMHRTVLRSNRCKKHVSYKRKRLQKAEKACQMHNVLGQFDLYQFLVHAATAYMMSNTL